VFRAKGVGDSKKIPGSLGPTECARPGDSAFPTTPLFSSCPIPLIKALKRTPTSSRLAAANSWKSKAAVENPLSPSINSPNSSPFPPKASRLFPPSIPRISTRASRSRCRQDWSLRCRFTTTSATGSNARRDFRHRFWSESDPRVAWLPA